MRGLPVELGRRLVDDHERRPSSDGERERGARLLSARELDRQRVEAVCKPDVGEEAACGLGLSVACSASVRWG